MSHVDALTKELVVDEIFQVDITEAEWLQVVQSQDDKIRMIYKILQKDVKSPQTKQYFANYCFKKRLEYKN